MYYTIKLPFLLLFLLLGLLSCKDDDVLQPQNLLEAKAGADQQVVTSTLVSLDGSASKDGNGKTFTFAWTIKSKPANSGAILTEPATARPAFTPDVAGTYVVELKISNDLGFATDELSITATAPNQEPNEPVAIIINEDITEDRVLEDIFTDGALADYIVTTDVRVSARLSVKPGVRIEFEQDKGLLIYPEGILIAKGLNDGTGTHDQRITFTGRSSSKGYWKGILISSNSPLNELENVNVEYAGSSSFNDAFSQVTANLIIDGSNVSASSMKISNSSFYNGAGYGLYVLGMSELTGFESNYFENNTGPAMYVPARQLHKLDFFSHFTGNNGFNGVETGGTIKHDTEVTWPSFNDGSAYYVSSDITIESGLRIAAGADFELKEEVVLQVSGEGYLDASGTDASKITFSARTKSGDLNWGGIFFNTNSELNKLQYTEVSYAGNKEVPFYPGIKANVAVSTSGKVTIENTVFKQGLGFGLVAFMDKGARLNENVTTINSFDILVLGSYKLSSGELNPVDLAGEWLNWESFTNGYAIDEQFYNRETGQWFRGAATPWTMNPRAGFGLKIDEEGNYLWTIAEYGPVAGCGIPYSAEFISGKLTASDGQFHFQEEYWRSMFFNPCDESQSVDTDVTPGSMSLHYEVQKINDMGTETPYWELKLFVPDGTFIKYYKY